MKPTDETVHVALPRTVMRYWLTPRGDEALDAAQLAHERAVADEARRLAVRRRNQPIPAPRQPLV